MRANEFTAFAERLEVQPATTPPGIRTASSRAYYAAYHQTREFLQGLGFSVGYQHNLQLWFIDCAEPTAHEIGKLLGNLQSNRILADYRLEQLQPEEPRFGRLSVELARRIETLLSRFNSDPLRSAIQEELAQIEAKRQPGNRGS
jgi:hypothetical protein